VAAVQFVKVAEYQARGLIHYHAIIRLDAPGDTYQPFPSWLGTTELCDAIISAAAAVTVDAYGPDGSAVLLRFGDQVDPRPIRQADGLPGTGTSCRSRRSATTWPSTPPRPWTPPASRTGRCAPAPTSTRCPALGTTGR
jgi:hypothetical protein